MPRPCSKPAALLIAAFMFSGKAPAQTPFIPDPKDLVSLEKTTLRTIRPAEVSVPDCDPRYRHLIETRFSALWNQCKALGSQEPSQCQRRLFQACTDLANKSRSLQPGTCARIRKEAGSISGGGAENQAGSQEKSADLHRATASAYKNVAAALRESQAKTNDWKKDLEASLRSPDCALSSSLPAYQKPANQALEEARSLEAELSAYAGEMEANAKGHEGAESRSQTNLASMQTAQTGSPGSALPAVQESAGSRSNWMLPAAAVAAPIALVALAKKSSGSNAPIIISGPPINPRLPVDASFTDREIATIQAALDALPECHRNHARSIPLRRQNLGNKGAGCVAGLWTLRSGRETIFLNPLCGNGLSVGVVVHEYMHSLARANGGRLQSRFREAVSRNPNCPVSDYAATSFGEDFAEAGRISLLGPPQRSGACVNAKVEEQRRNLQTCQ